MCILNFAGRCLCQAQAEPDVFEVCLDPPLASDLQDLPIRFCGRGGTAYDLDWVARTHRPGLLVSPILSCYATGAWSGCRRLCAKSFLHFSTTDSPASLALGER